MAMIYAAQFQRRFKDRVVGWIDMERSFLPEWAIAHGVEMDRIVVTSPDSAEDVGDHLKEMLESGMFSYITLDSVGGMISKREFEKDSDEMVVGTIAKIVTRSMKIATVRASQHHATVHVINQTRANIGGYGADTTSGGGWALKHMTTYQIQHKRTGEKPLMVGTGDNKDIAGQTFALHVAKNKLAPPKRTAMVTLLNQATPQYGPIGLDRVSEAFNLGELTDQFERGGAWYTLSDKTRHMGQEAVRAHLRKNPKLIDEIRERALSYVAHTVVTDELKEGSA
jgi:recombination protein RecA